MKKVWCILFLSFAVVGCNFGDEYSSVDAMNDTQRVWVFAQINVPEEGNLIETYYYYGEVSKSLYQRIANNTIEQGFFLMKNVKYWGDNDLIYDYRDTENTGEIVFRIEDIHRLKRVARAPIAGRGYEQFETPATTQSHSDEQAVEAVGE